MAAFFSPNTNSSDVDFTPLVGVLTGLLSENQLDNLDTVIKSFDKVFTPSQAAGDTQASNKNAQTPKQCSFLNNLKKNSSLPYARYADHENYFFYFDVPGASKEDIKLSISDEKDCLHLKLSYTRKTPNSGLAQHNELYSGEQTRVLQLPKDVDSSKPPHTKYENGVLSVTISKSIPKTSVFRNIPIL